MNGAAIEAVCRPGWIRHTIKFAGSSDHMIPILFNVIFRLLAQTQRATDSVIRFCFDNGHCQIQFCKHHYQFLAWLNSPAPLESPARLFDVLLITIDTLQLRQLDWSRFYFCSANEMPQSVFLDVVSHSNHQCSCISVSPYMSTSTNNYCELLRVLFGLNNVENRSRWNLSVTANNHIKFLRQNSTGFSNLTNIFCYFAEYYTKIPF